MSVLEQARALAEQLAALKDAARAELVELRKRVVELEAIVGDGIAEKPIRQESPVLRNPADPLSETDFGMGVTDGGGNGRQTTTEFLDELAEMKHRTAERRARR